MNKQDKSVIMLELLMNLINQDDVLKVRQSAMENIDYKMFKKEICRLYGGSVFLEIHFDERHKPCEKCGK